MPAILNANSSKNASLVPEFPHFSLLCLLSGLSYMPDCYILLLSVIYSTFAVRTDDLCDHQAFFVTEAYLRPDGIVLASLLAQIHSLNRSSAARSGRCSQVLGTSPNQQIGGRQCSGAESFLLRSGADLASESSNSGSDTERFSQLKKSGLSAHLDFGTIGGNRATCLYRPPAASRGHF